MTEEHKNFKLFSTIRQLPLNTKLVGGVVLFVLICYGVIFGVPKSVAFSYGGQDCVRQITLLPGIMRQGGDSGYRVTFSDQIVVAGTPLMSLKSCFGATTTPTTGEKNLTVSPWGGWFAAKHYKITVGDPPVANTADFVGKTLPVTRPVVIGLSAADAVFSYQLKVGAKIADCTLQDGALHCGIEKLDLKQGKEYLATLQRSFQGEAPTEIGSGTIKTLRALVLKKASVKNGQTVYSKRTSFDFIYDKVLTSATAALQQRVDDKWQSIDSTTSVKDKTVVVTSKDVLDREAEFRIVLKEALGNDGSSLADEYEVKFKVSGGPKVAYISIGRTGIPRSGSIVLTFDQEIENTSSISKLVSLRGSNSKSSITKSGKSLIIAYSGPGHCNDVKITVLKGLKSKYDVTQKSDWSYSARTVCYYTETIGHSRQGRAIIAYVFAGTQKAILYTGAIHGNEQSTKILMNEWINELNTHSRSELGNRRIVVVPSINPDGVAMNSRYNAKKVDLNRNFDTSDWKKNVETIDNKTLKGGGGSAPESEPEAKALANLTRDLSPSLTMSYHSSAGYAIGNTCGNSGSLAATYASMTGYQNMTGVSGAFSYEITGSYDDWMCEKLGLKSVLIELSTSVSSEFSRNKDAMWAMLRS